MSNYIVKGESLTAIADSIRTKTGNTEPMVFPDGFIEAVSGITTSGNSPEADLALTLWEERTAFGGVNGMFRGCTSLITVPLFDTSKETNFANMFTGCTYLTTVPQFDTSKGIYFGAMFSECRSLLTIPLFNTRTAKQLNAMFSACYSIVTVPSLDARNANDIAGMFTGCRALTECWLRNITSNLTVGSGTQWGHLLTVDSLLHLIKECRDTGSMKTLTVGTANLEKLANIYVKTIDITDEMRAEDDLIDEKLPFTVCESTDEGAMLIKDYVFEKNWQLK